METFDWEGGSEDGLGEVPVRGRPGGVNRPPDRGPLLVCNPEHLEHSRPWREVLVEALSDGDADGAREVVCERGAGAVPLLCRFPP
uniref:hypothetical protein n=1 Tax=Streptomyces sp. SS7 TaxID=3108485 RepID=UPI004040263F